MLVVWVQKDIEINTLNSYCNLKGETMAKSKTTSSLPVFCYSGKIPKKSKGAAEAQLRSLVKLGEKEELLNVYKCSTCNRWHVGHIRNNEKDE